MTNIILVEDDITLSMAIKYSLESEGFQIDTAKSLKETENKLLNNKYHLILLDVMLPDGSGYEICKSLRENKLTYNKIDNSNIPVIFLTACDEEANVVMGLDLGGDDYITKPIRIRELISRINAVLRRRVPVNNTISEEMKQNILVSGGLHLSPLNCKLIKNNTEITLTSIEYKLLLTLMNNSEKALTRSSLLENLWDLDGEFIDDNTLSVYIRRLREKIEDNPKNPSYIVTLRGIGYKWNKHVEGDIQ